MNKKALTLLEIIVSIIILSVTMIGLANIFISGKRYILHARARMGGGELGKFFLDPLQAEVREDTWNAPGNNLTVQPYPHMQEGVNNIIYNYTYTVAPAPGNANLRRVVAEIGWNETKP
jgi:Tfp pilus assembly protein PilV